MVMQKGLNMKTLIVIDMQNDFIDGSLGTKEAVSIVPNIIGAFPRNKDKCGCLMLCRGNS